MHQPTSGHVQGFRKYSAAPSNIIDYAYVRIQTLTYDKETDFSQVQWCFLGHSAQVHLITIKMPCTPGPI